MGIIRERLKEANPQLYQALQRSWEIAEGEWLPAIAAQKDSYNSYPHLRNLENYLDQVITSFEKHPSAHTPLIFHPAELYMILAAILFHDIGRAEEDRPGNERKTHGTLSRERITEDHGGLGIPSRELAVSLGKICEYHEPPERQTRRELERNLADTVIDPYGEVRERSIASLLVLIDILDSAYTRVTPDYLRPLFLKGTVGRYRRSISGTYVDASSRMVRMQLDPGALWDKETSSKDEGVCFKGTAPKGREGRRILERNSEHTGKPVSLLKRVRETLPDGKRGPLMGSSLRFSGQEWLLATGHRRLEPRNKKKPIRPSLRVSLAVVVGFLKKNLDDFGTIRGNLIAMGLPLWAWTIDCGDHLYNQWGEETYEPIFNPDYFERTAGSMWKLSLQTFGSAEFSYDTLAAEVREPDIEKMKTAVRRIGVLAQGLETVLGNSRAPHPGAIWFGETNWKWLVGKKGTKCDYVHLQNVIKIIRKLGKPFEKEGNG